MPDLTPDLADLARLLAEYESAVDAEEDSGELDALAAVMDATDALGSAAGRALPALLAETETLREALRILLEWAAQQYGTGDDEWAIACAISRAALEGAPDA